MPARLIQGDEVLLVKLGGTKEEFAAQLARVKAMSGKRYNPDHPDHGKVWEIPDDDQALLKLVHTVEPELPAGLLARVRSARQEQAAELVTQIPDDAELSVPWADRMAGKQRAGVEFMLDTAGGKALLADDMGSGKSVQAISVVYEFIIRDMINNYEDLHGVQKEEATKSVLQAIEDAGRTVEPLQSLHEGGQSETPGTGAENNQGGPGSSVRGLRDSIAMAMYGFGSCSGSKAPQRSKSSMLSEDPSGGDSKVPSSLSELSSLAALPRLVIAPNSVLGHWKRELKKWASVPDQAIFIIDGTTPKKRLEQLGAAAETPGAWVLINWEKLQRRVKLAGESAKKKGPLDKIKWLAVIADESHRMRNHDSQQSKAVQRLRAPIQIAASGTPVLNNPGELYATLHWLKPEQYTSFWAFYYSYTEFYKGYQGRDVIIGVKNADDLRFELSDKMVRRRKREIHPDIPEPLDPIIYEPPMSAKQAKIYAEAEKDFWFEIAQAPDISKEQKMEMVEALEDEHVSVETVKMMIPNAAARTMRMRQVATSPAILGGEDVSSKMDEAEQIVLSNGIDQPFVWFAWFKDTVDLLVHRFCELGADAHGFHGGNSTREDRAKLAADFQAGEFDIICATIKTGGTGIDLFRAADCGFIEEDWVPGENQQAFDRIDRKGQGFHPQRHILRAPDTVDVGKIAPKLATKTLIVETITGGMK